MARRHFTVTKHGQAGRFGVPRPLAGLLATALLAGSVSALGVAPAPAYADTTSGSGNGLPVTSPDAAALAQAEATGQSVPVTADNTANSTTKANPDGSYTYTDNVLPTQVQQNSTWVPVDPTLHTDSDGTLTPNAVESSVVFSDGGTNPLVTVSSPSGQQVSLSWPGSLPTPTVSGATATYADVYPGVNLAMTATVYGGYSEQLIITSASAAANPALADIHFNTSTTGLTLSDNAVGGLQATDSSGNVVFTSPTATMWSTPPATTSGSSTSNSQAAKSLAVKSQDSAATGTEATGDGTTNLGIDVTTNGLDLVPPAGALTASSNTYPVVIDPTLTPPPTLEGWGWVSSNDPANSYWEGGNNTHDSNAHVGYDDWCSDGSNVCASSAFDKTRTLFSFDMTRLAGTHVTSAQLTTYEQGPTSSESGTRQIDVHGAGGFDQNTTWNNQPTAWTAYTSGQFPSLNNSGIGSADIDVSSLIQGAVAQGYNTQTMLLEAHDETDDTAYRYLIGKGADAPALTVTYWSTPNVPTKLSTTNGTSTANCATTAPGTWINASTSGTIYLNASISTPDADTSENSDFWIHQTLPTADSPAHWTDLGGQTISSALPDGGASPTKVPTPTLQDGAQYQWNVYNQNAGGYSSAATPTSPGSCYFQADFTPPSAPVISAPNPPSTVGPTGSLTVTATDGGPDPSGIAEFEYNVNGTSLTAGGHGETPVTSTGTTSIPLKADHWGTNTVWIASVDKAGNQSQPIHYDFYVADTTYTPGTAGDLTGDGKSDLAAIDAAGNIRLYADPLDTTGTPPTTSLSPTTSQPAGGQILIPASSAPNTISFNGALIAHEGSFATHSCDDLAIIQGADLDIATANNNCQPTTGWTLTNEGRPNHVYPNTTNYSPDWSSVQQAVLLPSGSTTVSPTLVTQEDDGGVPTLWMTTFSGPTPQKSWLLATGSYWSNVTIMSPGMINGAPALWVRDNTTGALTQYPNIESWQNAPVTGTPSVGTSIVSSGYSAAQYPMLTTSGADAAGTGPTLWAVDPTGRLTYIPTTISTTSPYAPTIGTIEPVTSTGWANNIQNLDSATAPNSPGHGDIWPLGSTATGTDISTTNPAASTGTVSYTAGADGTPNGATVFDGSTTALATTPTTPPALLKPPVDTSSSYTVSAWVNLNSTTANSVIASESDNATAPIADGLQLYYSATSGSFAFGRHVADTTGAAFTAIYATTPATAGTWTHLVGVFNATTSTMTLYINGTQAATGTYTGTLWTSNYSALQIGRGVNSGSFNQYANAAIDQVALYSSALTPTQIAALNNP